MPADTYQSAQTGTARAVTAELNRLWRSLDTADLDGSWLLIRDQVVRAVTAGQVRAAYASELFLTELLNDAGLTALAKVRVSALAFGGTTSSGLPLRNVLSTAPLKVKQSLLRGATLPDAMASGLLRLLMIGQTETLDAGRGAMTVGMGLEPRIAGYERKVRLPACGRCLILAGRLYTWSHGFARHPRCFPAGVVVSGPGTSAATRRWYEGELVILTTASGKRLPVTGNHPVLTDRGWLPAHLLGEGDNIVSRRGGERATALVVPDEDQMPARIEDVWRSHRVVSLVEVPTTAEDFHGDGMNGHVDVVGADGLLGYGDFPPLPQPSDHPPFAVAGPARAVAAPFVGFGAADLLGQRNDTPAGSFMSLGGLHGSLLGGHLCGSEKPGLGVAADLYPESSQLSPYHVPADIEPTGDAVFAFTLGVGGAHRSTVEHFRPTRWDAPAGSFTVESRGAYACRGEDLRLRLAKQVELDRVVEAERVEFRGHVYNLTSAEGWYDANGLIVSNCDCVHVPVTSEQYRNADTGNTPERLFGRMSQADQDASLGKANADLVRAGANIGKIVNARRGMSKPGDTFTTAGVKGRRIETRLSPQGISRIAGSDRQLLEQLLDDNGYLT